MGQLKRKNNDKNKDNSERKLRLRKRLKLALLIIVLILLLAVIAGSVYAQHFKEAPPFDLSKLETMINSAYTTVTAR